MIFDEVQLFPLARQAIKYLVADGRYEYIETGSLISIKKNVQDILIPSEEYRIKMYPMDFEEYLWALEDDFTYDAMRNAFVKRKPLGDAIHRKIMKTFRTYMAVGGMPQAVEADEDLYKALIIDDLGINQGMILENMVAQMLRAAGHGLYFHEYLYAPDGSEKEKKYEIDFITVKKKKICSIEVKSSNYKSHKSFDYLIKKYQLKMEDRYIIYTKDLKYEDGITYIPIYMAAFV